MDEQVAQESLQMARYFVDCMGQSTTRQEVNLWADALHDAVDELHQSGYTAGDDCLLEPLREYVLWIG